MLANKMFILFTIYYNLISFKSNLNIKYYSSWKYYLQAKEKKKKDFLQKTEISFLMRI